MSIKLDEMSREALIAEVERLREALERYDDKWARVQLDNARLREALRLIATGEPCADYLAKQALNPQDK